MITLFDHDRSLTLTPTQVKNVKAMFYGASSFNSGSISAWDLGQVVDASDMCEYKSRVNF